MAKVGEPQWFDWSLVENQHGRHLPHLAQSDCIYFVTFRLADALPTVRLHAWRAQRDSWVQENPPPYTAEQERVLKSLFSARIERYLDVGRGARLLAEAAAQKAVQATLEHEDGVRYLLGEYVVMPNHVHVLVQTAANIEPLARQWLRVSSHRINRALGRKGDVWQGEPFDHIVRDRQRLGKCQRYIRANPVRLTPSRYFTGHGQAAWVDCMNGAQGVGKR